MDNFGFVIIVIRSLVLCCVLVKADKERFRQKNTSPTISCSKALIFEFFSEILADMTMIRCFNCEEVVVSNGWRLNGESMILQN